MLTLLSVKTFLITVSVCVFQSRLQRCAMDCQDRVRDKVSPSATEDELSRHKGELEKCVVKCADSHIDLIQPLLKKMKEVISKNQM